MIVSQEPAIRPLVSIVIPCYNEERFIGQCLDSIIANSYPKDRLEVIVVDGMSNDGTRSIVEEYARKYPFIQLLDNPLRITPKALNLGIQAARGKIVIRMDAHACYDPEYVSRCVDYLYQYNAENVGGVMQTVSRDATLVGKSIAFVMSSKFGVGDSIFRTGTNSIREVDTVFGGCYPREVFDKIGLFNEQFRRGQDREFNYRLRQAGGKIILAPDIKCIYYARSGLLAHMKHTFASGGVVFTLTRITRTKMYSWRNLVPLVFVISLLGSLIFGFFETGFLVFFLIIVFVYLLAAILASAPIVRKERDLRFLLITPAVFAVTHIAYGVGSLIELIRPIRREFVREV